MPTLHLIGHGHIDPTWLWRWTEGYEEVRSTFRSALDRLDEYPQVYFTATSACFYDWIARTEPDLLERIRARVAEGRWEIAGGMWIEPDLNIPSGEALVRQGLYGQRKFEELFGKRAEIGFNPDSFGHCGVLPQILRGLGMRYYAYMRPMPESERAYPGGNSFVWRSADGSEVLACNLLFSYNGDVDIIHRAAEIAASPHLNRGQRHLLGFFGVGNHGGGPTKAAIEAILSYVRGEAAFPENIPLNDPSPQFSGLREHYRDLPKEGPAPALEALPELRFSTLGCYFRAFEDAPPEASMPVIDGELQHHARGCYSAHSRLKRLNRSVEQALLTAERLASFAWLTSGMPYPKDALREAWTQLLYNQFHDILAGTCIPSAYDDARDMLGAARHTAHRVTNEAIQIIARDIDTTAEGNTIVVFNPHVFPTRTLVVVSPLADRTLDLPVHLVDDNENEVAVQAVTGEIVGGIRYVFIADLPPLGYRCYHVRSRAVIARNEAIPCSAISKEDSTLSPTLLVLRDPSDTWSHGVDAYTDLAGPFVEQETYALEDGPVLTTTRSVCTFNNSHAIVDTTCYHALDYTDITLRLNWQEPRHVLKLEFTAPFQNTSILCETPYAATRRACDGNEQPAQQWVCLEGEKERTKRGLAVINDGTSAYDATEGRLRITLLRSPAYAHHQPMPFDEKKHWPIMDLGEHTYRFRVFDYEGECPPRVWREAALLNAPPIAHIESAHGGRRAAAESFLSVDAENVQVTVVKQSEDGVDVVVRAVETSGRQTTSTLRLRAPEHEWPIDFAPYQIKTLRNAIDVPTLHEVSLLES